MANECELCALHSGAWLTFAQAHTRSGEHTDRRTDRSRLIFHGQSLQRSEITIMKGSSVCSVSDQHSLPGDSNININRKLRMCKINILRRRPYIWTMFAHVTKTTWQLYQVFQVRHDLQLTHILFTCKISLNLSG